jgi:hypothetical protein
MNPKLHTTNHCLTTAHDEMKSSTHRSPSSLILHALLAHASAGVFVSSRKSGEMLWILAEVIFGHLQVVIFPVILTGAL